MASTRLLWILLKLPVIARLSYCVDLIFFVKELALCCKMANDLIEGGGFPGALYSATKRWPAPCCQHQRRPSGTAPADHCATWAITAHGLRYNAARHVARYEFFFRSFYLIGSTFLLSSYSFYTEIIPHKMLFFEVNVLHK